MPPAWPEDQQGRMEETPAEPEQNERQMGVQNE